MPHSRLPVPPRPRFTHDPEFLAQKPQPEGRKSDAGKPRWSLLPRGTLLKVIQVLEAGAVKYDVENWKSVPDARTRYYDAMNRHIEAWWGGQKRDPETNIHHLAHAVCCALFLMWLDEPEEKV